MNLCRACSMENGQPHFAHVAEYMAKVEGVKVCRCPVCNLKDHTVTRTSPDGQTLIYMDHVTLTAGQRMVERLKLRYPDQWWEVVKL